MMCAIRSLNCIQNDKLHVKLTFLFFQCNKEYVWLVYQLMHKLSKLTLDSIANCEHDITNFKHVMFIIIKINDKLQAACRTFHNVATDNLHQ